MLIDTQAIRQFLLESAIRGKLTSNSSETPSSALISGIESEYHSLLVQKNTKVKVASAMISEDLFDLPESWGWFPLHKLCTFLSRGKSPTYSDHSKYPVFAQKCNQPTGLAIDRALFLDESTLEKWQGYYRLLDGDVVINSTGTGTVGRVGYYTTVKLNSEYPWQRMNPVLL